jgi:hypothetical protein
MVGSFSSLIKSIIGISIFERAASIPDDKVSLLRLSKLFLLLISCGTCLEAFIFILSCHKSSTSGAK